MNGLMMESRGARILVLILLGVALAAPVVAACACLASSPDPEPAASCHPLPVEALTAGCCCVDTPGDEVDGERATLPAPRIATAAATPAAELQVAPLATPESTVARFQGAPPPLAAPLRL